MKFMAILKTCKAYNYNYGGHNAYKYGGHNAANYGGHPAPSGRALTYDLCGQNVKVKINVKIKTNAVLTLILAF